MLEQTLRMLFWISGGLMIHTYLLYPLTLLLLPRRYRKLPPAGDSLPSVSVLIPALNEQKVIAEKIRNTLALSYPAAKLEVLIGSDGSTDDTDRIVQSVDDERVRLCRFEGRNGKYRVLNMLADQASGEILLLTDANVMIQGDFQLFIQHFADDSVAAVGAENEFKLEGGAGVSGTGERLYHLFISRIKKLESDIGGFSGLEGAAYAIRKRDWRALPQIAMNDDIVSLYPALASGHRVVFEPRLLAVETCSVRIGEEFRRRIRIGALNVGTLVHCRKLLSPTRPIVAYTFFSNKVIQWLFPVLMLVFLLTNALLIPLGGTYLAVFGAQLVLYTLAALGGVLALAGVRIPVLYQGFSFVAIMAAFLIGAYRYLAHDDVVVWERSPR